MPREKHTVTESVTAITKATSPASKQGELTSSSALGNLLQASLSSPADLAEQGTKARRLACLSALQNIQAPCHTAAVGNVHAAFVPEIDKDATALG